MRKGATMINVMVGLVILLIFALVFFGVVFPKIRGIFEEGRLQCDWSLFLHAMSKFGGVASVPPECKAERLTITLTDLDRLRREASTAIKRYNDDPGTYGVTIDSVNALDRFVDTDEGRYEWALDKIIADQMVACSDKVVKGKLPLFDEWWSLLDCKDEKVPGGMRKCALDDWSTPSKIMSVVAPGLGLLKVTYEAATGEVRFAHPPKFCVLCSRVYFDESVKKALGKSEIDSLGAWMAVNPVKRTSTAYLKYVSEWQTRPDIFRFGYAYDLDTPLGVLYQRMNVFKPAAMFQWTAEKIGFLDKADEPVNNLLLLPYTQDAILGTKDQEGECQWILD